LSFQCLQFNLQSQKINSMLIDISKKDTPFHQ
jgi:hypothetical protein